MSIAFSGQPFTFKQPDGSEIHLLGWGNQFEATFETLDGYTVTQDPTTGYYHYATLSDSKTELLPKGPRVGNGSAAHLSQPRHLRIRREASRARAAAAHGAGGTERRWETRRRERLLAKATAGTRAAAPQPAAVGDMVGLCILVQFPDVPGTITQQEVTNFCNQVGYSGFGNNGSAYDYFLNVSDGKLRYTNAVTPYYTAQHNRSYYTDPAIPYGTRAQELIREALTHLQSTGFNFAQLSSDGSNFVYAISVFYAGPRVNAWAQGLWPHSSSLASPFQATPTKKFKDYQITDMNTQLTLRTFCHENGHMVCDFPDLYDYGSESNGVGDYCLMCFGGSDKNPTEVNAYLKNEAGWTSSLTDVQPSSTYSVVAGRNSFLRLQRNANEYFMIENRQQSGRDAALPDAGLLIWHVDETGSNNNEQMTPTMHYELALEQADNRFDLEHRANSGDTGDLYGSPGNTTFGNSTSPNARWWDGTASGLEIISISAPGPTMTITTGFGAAFVLNNFGYNAGGWRVEKHVRLVADTTGDSRPDIVGFGDDGVWISRNNGNGTFRGPTMVVANFAYNAGGWRIERHPRFLGDMNGDGKLDIVGFGNDGVWVSRNNGNGTFQAPTMVIANFGYNAGGWRVEKHPRFLADMTGDGKLDIVGFGDDGVWISRNNGNGTFQAPTMVVANFAYNAGGWRVERHPRFLADMTGDGKLDIVGFGNEGVWISRNNGNGTFQAPQMVIANFAYNAGGWRVEKHPRFLADMNGDGRLDIVGCGDDGVWVARNNGNMTFQAPQMIVANFGYNAGGWRVEKHPRFVLDLNGDVRGDIIGFGDEGVWVARSV